MTEYKPDNWVILKVRSKDKFFYKVLGGWSGGYTQGDSWRMNSGITKVIDDGDYYIFLGQTGSTYIGHKKSNTVRMNIASILSEILHKFEGEIELMAEGIDWTKEELEGDWDG